MREDFEYVRQGTAALFMLFAPLHSWRHVDVRERRTAIDWAHVVRDLVDQDFPEVERIVLVMDNLNTHTAMDVLLFALAHPRWEFVFQPIYAAYLNLLEPWWKVLRSLALKGRRFDAWSEIEQAVQRATDYWNAHKHPFVWGRRRRHRTPRRLGIASTPKVALI